MLNFSQNEKWAKYIKEKLKNMSSCPGMNELASLTADLIIKADGKVIFITYSLKEINIHFSNGMKKRIKI